MKKIFTLLCVAFLATSLLANVVTGTCGDNLQWSYDTDTKALTITGSGDMWDYNSRENTTPWAQVVSEITSVSLPDGLTSIGNEAFSNCSALSSITIPNSVTSIGNSAFEYCTSFTSITIPNSVTSIGNSAFEYCNALNTVTIGKNVTSIGRGAFTWFTALTTVNYTGDVASWCDIYFEDNSANPMSQADRFYINDQEIKNLIIPNSVEWINNYAFSGCNFTSVTIPSSVISIGELAFNYCSKVTMQGTTPPSIAANTFNNNATIFVPCSAMDAYLAVPVWQFLDLNGLSHHVTLNATEGGSAQITAANCESNNVTIEAYASGIYQFKQWSDGNTDNPRTLTLTKDLTLTAEFEEIPYYTVTLNGNSLYGYVSIWDWNFYNESQVQFEVRGGTEVHFREDGGCGTWLGWSDGVAENERTIVITSDTTISSRFDVETYSVSITAGEGGYLEYGNIEREYNECNRDWIYNCAYANDGYYFVGWSDGNTNNCINIYPYEDINLVAQFAPKMQVTVLVGVDNASKDMGSVSGSGIFYSGDVVTISATPNNGYHFVEWSDGNCNATRELYLQSDTTLFATFAVGEYGGKCGDDLYWTYSDNTITITGSGNMDLDKYHAWKQYYYCYWYNNVTAVQFPEGITSIDDYAFSEMFLTNVVVPASVTYFGERAFSNNYNLTRFEYQGTEAECEGDEWGNGNILQSCHNLHYFKGQVNMLSYDNDYLDTVIITSGEMFDRYYNTTYIDNSNANNTYFDGYSYSEVLDVETLLLPNGLQEIGNYALYNARHLEQITIPAGVARIGEGAFEECRSLESVTFTGTVLREIDDWAFYNCHSLKDITIPVGVTSIGKAAFFDCSYLKEITLPSTVQTVADNAFGQCQKVAKMTVNATTPPIVEAETFEDIDRSIPLYVPIGTAPQYKAADYWCEFFNVIEYNAPTSVDYIPSSTINCQKIIRDGQLLIIRDGKTYNAMGQEL